MRKDTHTQTVLRYYNIDEFQVSKMCVDMIIYSANYAYSIGLSL